MAGILFCFRFPERDAFLEAIFGEGRKMLSIGAESQSVNEWWHLDYGEASRNAGGLGLLKRDTSIP